MQQGPVLFKLGAVNLGPGLDKPPLGLRQTAAQTLDGIDGEDRQLILVAGVEVGTMMPPTRFDNRDKNTRLRTANG